MARITNLRFLSSAADSDSHSVSVTSSSSCKCCLSEFPWLAATASDTRWWFQSVNSVKWSTATGRVSSLYVTIKIRINFVTVSVRFAVSHRVSFAIFLRDLARPIDITFVQTVQNCEIQPLSSCKTPSKSLPLLSLATAHAGTLKKTEWSITKSKHEVYLLTHRRSPSILIYITHPIMRLWDFDWCFPRVLMMFSTVIMGLSHMTQHMLSMPDWMLRTEAHRITQAGSVCKRHYYLRWLKDRKISVFGIGQCYFLNSYDIAKRSYTWCQKGSYLTSKIPLFENWKWRSRFAKMRCHNAIMHAWLRPCLSALLSLLQCQSATNVTIVVQLHYKENKFLSNYR